MNRSLGGGGSGCQKGPGPGQRRASLEHFLSSTVPVEKSPCAPCCLFTLSLVGSGRQKRNYLLLMCYQSHSKLNGQANCSSL